MANKSTQQRKRDSRRAATILDAADITGLSTSEIYKVMNGDRENDKVVSVVMAITEGKNKLLEHVKELVPFL